MMSEPCLRMNFGFASAISTNSSNASWAAVSSPSLSTAPMALSMGGSRSWNLPRSNSSSSCRLPLFHLVWHFGRLQHISIPPAGKGHWPVQQSSSVHQSSPADRCRPCLVTDACSSDLRLPLHCPGHGLISCHTKSAQAGTSFEAQWNAFSSRTAEQGVYMADLPRRCRALLVYKCCKRGANYNQV